MREQEIHSNERDNWATSERGLELEGHRRQQNYYSDHLEKLRTLMEVSDSSTSYGRNSLKGLTLPEDYIEFARAVPIIGQQEVRRDPYRYVGGRIERHIKKQSGGTTGAPKEFYWPAEDFDVEFTSDVVDLIRGASSPAVVHGAWESTDFDVVDASVKKVRPDIPIETYTDGGAFLDACSGHDVIYYVDDVQSVRLMIRYIEDLIIDGDAKLETLKGVQFVIEPGDEAMELQDFAQWFDAMYRATGKEPILYGNYSQIDTGLLGLYKYDKNHSAEDIRYEVPDSRFVEVVDPLTEEPVIGRQGKIIATTYRGSGTILLRYDTGDIGEAEYDDEGRLYLSKVERDPDQGMVTYWGTKLYVTEIVDHLKSLTDIPFYIEFEDHEVNGSELDRELRLKLYIPAKLSETNKEELRVAFQKTWEGLKDTAQEDLRDYMYYDETDIPAGPKIKLIYSIEERIDTEVSKTWKLTKS